MPICNFIATTLAGFCSHFHSCSCSSLYVFTAESTMWPLSFQEFGQEGCAAANGSRCWGRRPGAAWTSMEVAAFTPGQLSSRGLCGKANIHRHHPATLFWPPCSSTLWTQDFFFFLEFPFFLIFEHYIQWFLWGELSHEELEQSLCWRIFACSFDVLSRCCSQIQLNCTMRRIPVCKLWNTVAATIKSQHLINTATYHWLADTTLFALLQSENYSGVWFCTWIRLRTFKPPCNWTNEIKS